MSSPNLGRLFLTRIDTVSDENIDNIKDFTVFPLMDGRFMCAYFKDGDPKKFICRWADNRKFKWSDEHSVIIEGSFWNPDYESFHNYYVDADGIMGAIEVGTPPPHIYIVFSEDNGLTWETRAVLDIRSIGNSFNSVFVKRTGGYYYLFINDGYNEISYLYRSTDGYTWTRLGTGDFPYCGVALAGDVFYAFHPKDYFTGGLDLYRRYSDSLPFDDPNWSSPVNVWNPTNPYYFPVYGITINVDDCFIEVFQNKGMRDCNLILSEDQGGSWYGTKQIKDCILARNIFKKDRYIYVVGKYKSPGIVAGIWRSKLKRT